MATYKGSSDFKGPSRNDIVETISPGNGNDAVPSEDTEICLVNPDGTNTVDMSNAAEQGRRITIVHNGGSNTPTLSFDDSDFVNTGPSNITSQGATATLICTDGTDSGWVQEGTGSA